jgi:4-alpha-glucanotransferase
VTVKKPEPHPALPKRAPREAGVLLHPTSLPGPHGVGDLGAEARRFIDFLSSAGVGLWQVLPLNPTGNNCPYVGWSVLAGNPLLVDLGALRDARLLDGPIPELPNGPLVDFDAAAALKMPRLEAAAERLLATPSHPLHAAYAEFRASEGWAEDAATFWALKRNHDQKGWWDWEPSLRDRQPEALAAAKQRLAAEIEKLRVILFFFEHQWKSLRAYAHEKGVKVLGDLPIYVDWDSADVWMHRAQFYIGDDGRPTLVSGVPPDYFSELGQLWGNPLYRWDVMAKDGFAWWKNRLRRALSHTDVVRIDHFRAFSAYWEVPFGAPDARKGRWAPGPKLPFFEEIRKDLGDLPLVAEDLGTIDDDVHAVRLGAGLAGMRVLQFGFDGDPDNTHLPHNHTEDSVVYTGTHDNDTTVGWWDSAPDHIKTNTRRYLGTRGDDIALELARAALASVGRMAILPVQDVLRLGTSARMNNPGTVKGNWGFRLERALDPAAAAPLGELVWAYGRKAKPPQR